MMIECDGYINLGCISIKYVVVIDFWYDLIWIECMWIYDCEVGWMMVVLLIGYCGMFYGCKCLILVKGMKCVGWIFVEIDVIVCGYVLV